MRTRTPPFEYIAAEHQRGPAGRLRERPCICIEVLSLGSMFQTNPTIEAAVAVVACTHQEPSSPIIIDTKRP